MNLLIGEMRSWRRRYWLQMAMNAPYNPDISNNNRIAEIAFFAVMLSFITLLLFEECLQILF